MMLYISICALLWSSTGFTAGYDEAYDKGRPRPTYRDFAEKFNFDALRPSARLRDFMLGRPLADSQKALPVPLVLERAEHDAIRAGTLQRARVYRAFFHDVVMGEQKIFAHKGERFRALVESAFVQEKLPLPFLRRVYMGHPLEQVRFIYAPDLVREPGGRWVVLEDNVGANVGGLVDVDHLREAWADHTGLLFAKHNLLEDFITTFLEESGAARDATPVLVRGSGAVDLSYRDDESLRIETAAEEMDMVTESINVAHSFSYRRRVQRPSFVNLVDLREVADVTSFVTLTKDLRDQNVELFESLGVAALGNKIFLPYIDELAQFYLGETLTLRSPQTIALNGPDAFLRAGHLWKENFVIKAGNGLAGEKVYFWDEMNFQQRMAVERIASEANALNEIVHGLPVPALIAQPIIATSHLPVGPTKAAARARIDLRPIAYVGPKSEIVSRHLWGRAATAFGNRRQNVSQGAMQLVVMTNCSVALGPRERPKPAARRPRVGVRRLAPAEFVTGVEEI